MKEYISFNKTSRKWHLPIVAGLTVGIPVLLGWYFENIEAGKLASLAGLAILYIQSNRLDQRMMILMTCCFGIMVSYTVGLLFSFNMFAAPLALGLLSFGVHYSLHQLQLNRPPGNFFFLMLASMAICTPFEPKLIPEKVGYVAMGAILTCGIGLVYSLLTLNKSQQKDVNPHFKSHYTNIVESLIFGFFMSLSLAIAFAMNIEKPYWVPISCLAVIQGSSSKHTWLRGTQRILGTLIGVIITWLIVSLNPSTLMMVLGIILLQVIVEFLVVRNYGVAVIFITVLTVFLAESGNDLTKNTNQVFMARLVDIIIGSVVGIIGGWALYHQQVHYFVTLRVRKSKLILKKRWSRRNLRPH